MRESARSLESRVLWRLLPLLALVLIGAIAWLGEHVKRGLHALDLELARREGQAIVSVIGATMAAGGGHAGWRSVGDRIAHAPGFDVTILDTGGAVLVPTTAGGGETSRRLDEFPCNGCHVDGSSRPHVDNIVSHPPGEDDARILAVPLHNSEACKSCHRENRRRLGLVLVKRSLRPIRQQVRSVQIGLAAVAGVVLLTAMLTTRRLLGRYVTRPLGRLVAGAERIHAGDPHQALEAPEHPQLALLADTLNSSAARLAHLEHEVRENARLAEIGQTVAGLSHGLKNVLNGLRAGQYVIDRALASGDDEKLRRGLRVTKTTVRRVERLIFDMLYYAKERVPRREAVDPNQLMAEVIDALKDLADGLGVELRADLDPEIGLVALDRTGVFRAIIDLVTNAIDACTESESGNLVILKTRGVPDQLVLTVEDNGIGMSEEVLSRIYSRFFSTKAAGGTGLGLHVVKKMAEEHGGTIEVDSVPGEGTAFHIHLPRSVEASARQVEDRREAGRENDAS